MKLEQLQKEMVTAMKNKDKLRKDAISSLIGAIKNAGIAEGCKDNISDELVSKVVLKEIKTIKEQIDTCPDSRTELKAEYKARLAVVEEFAPKLLTEDEVTNIIKTKFQSELESGNKGLIMKAVMSELKGKADGKVINAVVSKLLK